MKLLLAEDTEDMNRAVCAMLRHDSFDVDPFFDGEAALNAALQNGYDAMILDIMMPLRDGISVLTEIRKRGIYTPVLLLTAKAEVDDRVAGLEAGADDYLPKPFSMKELLARVHAMTRRKTVYDAGKLVFSDFSLDMDTLTLSAENSVRLSLREAELLQVLMKSQESPLGLEHLLSRIWGGEPESGEETVKLYVNFVNRKLASVASLAAISREERGFYLEAGKPNE